MNRGRRTPSSKVSGEDGIALIMTLLVVLVVGTLVMGAVMLGSSHLMADRSWIRRSQMVGLADAGLEMTRSYLNAGTLHLPESGYSVVEKGASVYDGEGRVIPDVERWTYVGPSVSPTGQVPVSWSIVSEVRDKGGGIAIRRQHVYQQSFAAFSYFTDDEGDNTYFADNDHVWGPLHTNGRMVVHPTHATFHDEVTVGQDIYQPGSGVFKKGFREQAPVIPMPGAGELRGLMTRAKMGHTAFVGDLAGEEGEATTRIEFIPIDLNGDGDSRDEDEGFFRVYQSTDPEWLSGKITPSTVCVPTRTGTTSCVTGYDIRGSENCGDYHAGTFVSAADHDPLLHGHDASHALRSPSARCYLGGDDRLWGGFVADDGKGHWLRWGGPVDPRLKSLRPDAAYLFPISSPLNPDFDGVVYVEGKVLLSGEIRGRITVAATGNIIFGDDLTYATDPGSGKCNDTAGYFSAEKVVVSNNLLNAPIQVPGQSTYYTLDESAAEFFHGVILALDVFAAEAPTSGPTSAESCGSTPAGRGCIYLTGGVIQRTRGPVGSPDGHGHVPRYSYDKCAATRPPPHFPTTGVFVKGQYYQVDPNGFDVERYYSVIARHGPQDARE